MYGVFINGLAIIIGSCIGLIFSGRLPKKITQCIEYGLGVSTFVLGIKMAMQYQNVVVLISCVALGGIIGTLINLETNIEKLAHAVQKKFSCPQQNNFARGFTISSILYCTGAMAVVGSINAGVLQDYEIFYTKSMLDGFISISFAAIYGVGVAFSALTVIVYQGSLTLLASYLDFLVKPEIINDISGVGGVLITMIGVNITGLKKIPVGDFLPGMLLVLVVAAFLYQ